MSKVLIGISDPRLSNGALGITIKTTDVLRQGKSEEHYFDGLGQVGVTDQKKPARIIWYDK